MSKQHVIVTFGTFDLFHIGHVRLLQRAAVLGALHVGVSSDAFTFLKKQRMPVFSESERLEIVGTSRFVSSVFLEESFDRKREYLMNLSADVMVMGDDWVGQFDEFSDICKVVYLPRTQSVCTTDLLASIQNSPLSS
ncbi:Glycerol-3-phosphate cytidylyltransferase [Paraburkholderia nemoris]|uniref:adenylyltransferase/cytidyltransferase family protein n=1 Tax=Paraburkholderia nemoris TaxID=2793076 RepID=UPI00190935AE|nr:MULTISPECIES: adenylyltransferase/cytidyltransferase family protein [Paraburkholderia]MBK3786667.1 adenylyltransferase/cytidyltransferase family protein [Paraburkholderia aspalathi]CAE6859699.1 Glycerol-3-phosphate cytidylyltransferase [Paraburkholderia nemoris]